MTRVILFDDGKGRLAPLTDLRPSFDVRTGALTAVERWRCIRGEAPGLVVAAHRRASVTERHPGVAVNVPVGGDDGALVVNGRCAVSPEGLEALGVGEGIREEGSGDLVAARLDAAAVARFVAAGGDDGGEVAIVARPALALLSRPWHIRTFRDRSLGADLALIVSGAPACDAREMEFVFDAHGVIRREGSRIYPGAIIDAEGGPVVLDTDSVVRPGAVLIGPCYVGPHSTVLERATIRPNTAIGPWCKVNGEVGGVIFQGYANKAHDGFLGDSWVGEWVNLGAGTTGSNLLNTYGEVISRAAPDGLHERTGETFFGAVIGDHVKTAICTRLMTGAVLHTGSMFATTAPVSGCVAPFTWATDAGSRLFRFDKFLEVARAAMARRKEAPSAAYTESLARLHREAAAAYHSKDAAARAGS